MEKNSFFASLKSDPDPLAGGTDPADPDSDPYQKVTDPEH